MSKIGPIIRLHRQKTGKMQKEYAELLNISTAQMTRLEHGQNEAKEGTVLNMLEVLIPDIKQQILNAEVELLYKNDERKRL